MHYLIILFSFFANLSFAGTITDSAGKTVTSNAPKRIVTLGGNVTEIVFELGLGDKVIGVDVSSLYPAKTKSLPKVGYHRHLSAEGLLSLGPDLIIGTDDSGPPEVIEQIRSTGISIAILSGEKSLSGVEKRITQASKLLDKTPKGAELVEKIQGKMKSRAKAQKNSKVLFIYARSAGSANVAGQETAANAMIELAGAKNAVQQYTGYKPINAEAIIAAQPDYILLTSKGYEALGKKEGVLGLAGVSLTPAGKKGQIIVMDDLLLLGFGPRLADAILELSSKIN